MQTCRWVLVIVASCVCFINGEPYKYNDYKSSHGPVGYHDKGYIGNGYYDKKKDHGYDQKTYDKYDYKKDKKYDDHGHGGRHLSHGDFHLAKDLVILKTAMDMFGYGSGYGYGGGSKKKYTGYKKEYGYKDSKNDYIYKKDYGYKDQKKDYGYDYGYKKDHKKDYDKKYYDHHKDYGHDNKYWKKDYPHGNSHAIGQTNVFGAAGRFGRGGFGGIFRDAGHRGGTAGGFGHGGSAGPMGQWFCKCKPFCQHHEKVVSVCPHWQWWKVCCEWLGGSYNHQKYDYKPNDKYDHKPKYDTYKYNDYKPKTKYYDHKKKHDTQKYNHKPKKDHYYDYKPNMNYYDPKKYDYKPKKDNKPKKYDNKPHQTYNGYYPYEAYSSDNYKYNTYKPDKKYDKTPYYPQY